LPKPPKYAVYIRGRAHLAAGNARAASADFQKILDHPALVEFGVTGPLAHLYLGRARALEARSPQNPAAGNARAKARCVPGVSPSVEGRRSGYPHPAPGQSRVREVAIGLLESSRVAILETI
jgi:hypothetical protein